MNYRSIKLALVVAMLFGVPTAALADDAKRRVLRARDVSEESISEEYARMAEQKRLESIRRLKELIIRPGVEGETKAEMMLRLADLYFQQGRALYLREMADFDKAYDACFNTEGCAPDEIAPENANSQSWQKKSIKLYSNILQSYPRYGRADQATYFLGAAHQDLGHQEEALKSFKKLVKLYPQSTFVADAFVLIGEYYFEENNAYQALRAYQKATQYKDSERYPFAMYKLGWCYYNVGDYGKGIDTMKAVVSYSMSQEGSGSALQLQNEALKDLVRFFADAGEIDEAYEYFIKLGKKDLIQKMLLRLANLYFEQGKFDESIDTYRRLILENPQSPSAPEYQHEIIQAYRKIGQKEKTLEEIDRLRKDYGKQSAWARANGSDQDAVSEAERHIEENLRRVAVEYHNQARTLSKSRHPDAKSTFNLAYRAYKTYLEEFPQGEHLYNVRYAFGELLHKTKRFDEAYEQYMAVVKLDPKGKHSRFCAEGAIHSADEMVSREGGNQTIKAEPGKGKEPQPLTDWEQRLVDAAAQYAELYPEDKNVRTIIYRSAYLLYNKYRFEEAAAQFKRVIKMDPKSKQAEQAANLILDSFVVNEDWDNLKANAKFYFDQEGLGSSSFKKDVYNIYQRASFKLIEVNLTNDGDKSKAADAFVAFYEEFPEADTAPQALNNASVYYFEVNRVADTMKVRHILIDDPAFGPKTKYYYDQIALLGYNYETVADFSKAADYYEKLFTLYPDHRTKMQKADAEKVAALDEQAAGAIYSSALFRNALGDWKTSIKNYGMHLERFPESDQALNIRLIIAKTYEDQEDWTNAANSYYQFYSKYGKDADASRIWFARLHHGKTLEAQGQTAKAIKLYEAGASEYEKYMDGGGKPAEHTDLAAEMMFVLAQKSFDEMVKLELKGAGPGASKRAEDKALAASLKKKNEDRAKVEATYSKIISTGAGKWGIAGLVKLGQIYENMAKTFDTGHIPSYLTDSQREIYEMKIEDQVYQWEEKAVQAYKLAVDKSYELTEYNENTALAARRLGELRPDDFPGLWEKLLKPGYASSTRRDFPFETEL
jgi:TolA-binding protein